MRSIVASMWMTLALALLVAIAVLPARAQAPAAPAAPAPPGLTDPLRRSWDLKADALADFRQGRYRDGIAKAQEALTLREQVLGPDHVDVAAVLHLLGQLYTGNGEYAPARTAFERALRIREQALGPDNPDVADTLDALAHLRFLQGALAAARPLHERALRIRESTAGPDSAEVAESLNDLSLVLIESGDYAAARTMLERALAIRERTLGPNHGLTAQTLSNLGRVLREQGEYDAARLRFERALRIQESVLGPTHPAVGFTLLQLGALHQRLGDPKAARPLYERALAIREQAVGPNDPVVAGILTDLAFILRNAGDHAAATSAVERALRIREQALGPNHPLVGETVRIRALISLSQRSYPAARADFERALRIQEQATGPSHPRVGLILSGLGWVLWQTRDFPEAQAAFERAVRIFRNGGYPEAYWRTAWNLGRLHERQGRLVEAASAYREAVTTIRSLAQSLEGRQSRAQYLEAANRLEVFDALARVLLRLHEKDPTQGYGPEAWTVIEAKKALVVADALTAARPALQDPAARTAAEQVDTKRGQAIRLERSLREEEAKDASEQKADRIKALTTELARTKAEYLGQVEAFLQRYPRYRAQFVEQETVDPKALAKFAGRLPTGTVAVQYFAAHDALYIFVVASGQAFQVKRQAISQQDLYTLVRQYRELVERGAGRRLPWADDGSDAYRQDVAPLREVTEKLSAQLLAPIETELAQNSNLILFPNDLLLYLPIHALTRKGSDGARHFLAESHVVSYVTQLELIDLLSPPKASPDEPILALANPDGSLPAASREVRELARIRPGVTTLEGADATKPKFLELASQFPEIHLATHGVLDPERPDRSYLLLAGNDKQSQQLTVGEIAGLSLSPHALAILSGCETALGEQVPGAALVTLAAAFSQAGSQSIVASLWKVSDAPTRDFMIAFHRALPSAGRAAALAQAELAVLKNPATAHPYYWAPFILIGGR